MKKIIPIFLIAVLSVGCAMDRQRFGQALTAGSQTFSNDMKQYHPAVPKNYTIYDRYGMPEGRIREDV